MPDWKILVADRIAENGLELLQSEAQVEDRAGISAKELVEEIEGFDALIVRGRTRVTKAVLEAASGLKVVGRAGVGVDNIDLASAQAKGVAVVNTPMATTTAVAELTMGAMLDLARGLSRADKAMKTGQWLKRELRGVELSGRVLGVIGVGRIGTAVGKRAKAFGMTVLGYDPLISADEVRERGAEPVDLLELYQRSDFISLHLPLTPQSRGLIDGEALARMKRGVYLICAARGGVIDETALLARLESGQVAGAALDVFAKEPPGLTALVAHPQVLATPHIGAQTAEAQTRAAQHVAEEVLAALRGDTLRWQIV